MEQSWLLMCFVIHYKLQSENSVREAGRSVSSQYQRYRLRLAAAKWQRQEQAKVLRVPPLLPNTPHCWPPAAAPSLLVRAPTI